MRLNVLESQERMSMSNIVSFAYKKVLMKKTVTRVVTRSLLKEGKLLLMTATQTGCIGLYSSSQSVV